MFVTFARAEVGGKDRHIALILEKGMKGFEVGERYDTMGLRGNDLRHLYFNDVRVPAENVLGEPGEGFRIAMHILNNGRLSLGTGSVGATKGLLDRVIDHVKERRQFGRPLADFELVQDKIAWMVSYLFGLESMTYLTCGMVDAGVPDYSLESAICKVSGTEFLWYAANRALQLKGGAGYMRDEPYEKVLRDIRIFPIFEGANDVLRAFIALTGVKPLGEQLSGSASSGSADPIGSIGVVIDYVSGRIQREVRPDRITSAHPEISEQADAVSDQVKRLRDVTERCCASTAGRSSSASSSRSGSPTRSPTSSPRSPCCRASPRSSRSRASRSRDRRATSPRPSAPAPPAACGALRPDRGQRRRAHGRDREAGLEARRVRLRALRGLTADADPSAWL